MSVSDSDTPQELNSSSRSNTNMVVDEVSEKSPVIAQQLNAATTTTPPLKRLDHLLDNRLTKQAPIKSNNMPKPTLPASSSSAPGTSKTTEETFSVKLNSLNAGKAVPLKGNHEKTSGEFTIKISNSTTNTSFGSLSLIACHNLHSRNELWKINVGSSIVNFSLSQKNVLACSLNGTLRFLDVQTGICVLPVIKLPTAAIQSAFVRSIRFVYFYFLITTTLFFFFFRYLEHKQRICRHRYGMWFRSDLERRRTIHLHFVFLYRSPHRFVRRSFSHYGKWHCLHHAVEWLLVFVLQKTGQLVSRSRRHLPVLSAFRRYRRAINHGSVGFLFIYRTLVFGSCSEMRQGMRKILFEPQPDLRLI